MGRLGTGKRVGWVLLVAIEIMLAVDDRLSPLRDDHADAFGDRGEIVTEPGPERHADLVIGSLGDEHDGIGGTVEEGGEAGIIGGRATRAPRHAEGGETRILRALLLEEFGVLRIGAGIASLDITDAEFVEKRSDLALVLEREIDACHLRAIAQ